MADDITSPIILDDVDQVDGELLEFSENYARDIALSAEALERRKASILASVALELRKLNEVKITEEMRELGLEEKIFGLIQEAEAMYQIHRFLNDEDDFDTNEIDPYWFLRS